MLKLDGCYASESIYETGYPNMTLALNKTGRPIVFSCSWPAYIKNVCLFCLLFYLHSCSIDFILNHFLNSSYYDTYVSYGLCESCSPPTEVDHQSMECWLLRDHQMLMFINTVSVSLSFYLGYKTSVYLFTSFFHFSFFPFSQITLSLLITATSGGTTMISLTAGTAWLVLSTTTETTKMSFSPTLGQATGMIQIWWGGM